MKEIRHYINGHWRHGRSQFKTFSPTSGQSTASVSLADSDDVAAAVESASSAQKGWAARPISERCSLIGAMVPMLLGKGADPNLPSKLQQTISADMGKLKAEADIEVMESADMVQFFVDSAADRLQDVPLKLDGSLWPTKSSVVKAVPYGVTGIIKPWNYPLEVPLWSIAAALVAGNAVVFKPSEHASLVGEAIAKMFSEINLPPGVFNVIFGEAETGSELVKHQGTRLISFTGSYIAGKEIGTVCGEQIKKCILELSGNDAAVICEDADLDLAINGILWGALCNAGQVCTGIKRVIVIGLENHKKLLARLFDTISKLRIGKDIGPIISEAQLRHLETQISEVQREGGKIEYGGKRTGTGYFYEPTLLSNIGRDSLVFREEIFGPVVALACARDVDEAISLANATEYGLGASVWTQDLECAQFIGDALEVGMVWHNDVNVAFPQAPWGGVKRSGVGVDLSIWAIDEYVTRKHYCFEKSTDKTRPWWFPYQD